MPFKCVPYHNGEYPKIILIAILNKELDFGIPDFDTTLIKTKPPLCLQLHKDAFSSRDESFPLGMHKETSTSPGSVNQALLRVYCHNRHCMHSGSIEFHVGNQITKLL